MVARGLVAVLVLSWLTPAVADEPVAPTAAREPMTVIWLPVAMPGWNGASPYYMPPPPWVWWMRSFPQPPVSLPMPTPQTVPPEPVSVLHLPAAMPVADPVSAIEPVRLPPAQVPTPVAESRQEASPAVMPDTVSERTLAPLEPEAQGAAVIQAPAKPRSALKKRAAKPAPAKPKPRKLCWKDSVLTPCP